MHPVQSLGKPSPLTQHVGSIWRWKWDPLNPLVIDSLLINPGFLLGGVSLGDMWGIRPLLEHKSPSTNGALFHRATFWGRGAGGAGGGGGTFRPPAPGTPGAMATPWKAEPGEGFRSGTVNGLGMNRGSPE